MSISPNRLKELQNIPDTAIDTSDIPELDQQFWETAKMVKPVSQEAALIQLDQDILDWFKSKGKGYQSLINSALRSYIEHNSSL
ncbi:BrnA antitoxin family protein [Nostoc sp. CHAB 5784]|uniref:BrnA antitoxin family protein n=1 Tax=Nostoc mirabile TaxID=2907820 RepID=UPI001E2BCE2C|nr:BrnA antitoxin family protein [Nostoc mirabile]MCC5665851.1 BrnA antitoxin family protein [Nostoc mirabile CHAB5784]